MRRRSLLATTLAAPALASRSAPARAAAWPPSEVKIIVPFPAGRVTDLVARIVAEGLREAHGTVAVVENRPGANATIGMGLVSRSAPDGRTLMVGGLGSHGLPPAVIPNFPFDVDKDFSALAIMAEFVNVMVVSSQVTAPDVASFIAEAKARPGAMNYPYTSTGASNQMTAELFKQQTGTDIVGVPLGQVGNSLVMLQRNDVQVAFENLPTVLGAVRDGNLRALAVTSPYRTPALPNLPTMQEAGLADFSVTSWIGLYGPPGLPPAMQAAIESELRRIAEGSAAKDRLRSAGFEPAFRAGADFARFQRGEVERWRGVVRSAGLRIQG